MEDVAFAEYVINRLEARGFTIVKKEIRT